MAVGETEAIALALELRADLLLMDDRRGVKAARRHGIDVTGTLGVLGLAGKHGLVNLVEAFDLIKTASFRYPQAVMDEHLNQQSDAPESHFFAAGASIAGTLAS